MSAERQYLGDISDYEFRDTGCRLHPACLTCPREVCVLDEKAPTTPGKHTGIIEQMLKKGLHVQDIAEQLNMSKRAVYRHQARLRNESAARL